MLITDKFIVLNYPKTGSTFMRKILKEIHYKRDRKFINRVINRIRGKRSLTELWFENQFSKIEDQHGKYYQIPEVFEHPEKQMFQHIYSVYRDPYELFLSRYEFGWWAKFSPIPQEEVLRCFPHFPDLNFEEYCELQKMNYDMLSPDGILLGQQSKSFIEMYSMDPKLTLEHLMNGKPLNDYLMYKFAKVHFLRNEFLNEDLKNFLKKYNYSKKEIDMVDETPKLNVSESRGVKRSNLWTAETLHFFETYEAPLFKILDHYGLTYKRPEVK